MNSNPVELAAAAVEHAIELLRAAGERVSDVESLGVVQQCERLTRRLHHVSLETLGRLERRGTLGGLGLGGAAAGIASLTGCDLSDARRVVSAARHVTERTSVEGQLLPAVLPDTAALWDEGAISLRHVEVIAALCKSPAARRLSPEVLAGAEEKLAEAAAQYTPAELRAWGNRLFSMLDQDGPEPGEDYPQPNELWLSPMKRGGGRIRGTLNAFTYDALQTALGGLVKPPKRGDDDHRPLAERRADGLAELAMFALTWDESMATCGGARPHLNVTIGLAELETKIHAAMLDYGGQISAGHLRAIACDCGITPIVLGSNSEPLDIGRNSRTIPPPLRNAVIARDRGCAFPGCDRPPAWSEIHHIVHWAHHGKTSVRNLVMVCVTHHHMLHETTGWTVKITNGLPEFTPPAWIDPSRTPRRKPPAVIRA